MGLFDVNDDRLQGLYSKAFTDTGHGFVDPRNHPDLDRELRAYASLNNCSYDDALTFAKTGRKTGKLENQ